AGGLRHWQANVAGAAAGDDPEFVHQLRVSQRRLRSLIALFAPALPAGMVSQWRALLRDNAASVGDTRDPDVLADQIIAPVAGVTDAEIAALGRLAARIASAREAARAQGRGALDSARQGRLLLDFAIALETLPTNNLIGAVDLGAFARLQLEVVAERVAKRLRAARCLEPAALHAPRIARKQARGGDVCVGSSPVPSRPCPPTARSAPWTSAPLPACSWRWWPSGWPSACGRRGAWNRPPSTPCASPSSSCATTWNFSPH